MNIIFLVVTVVCGAVFTVLFPQNFLPAMLTAAGKAAALSLTLLSSYSVWMGFMQVVEDSSLAKKLSRGLKPVCGALFKTKNDEAKECLAINISANFLGLGGMATPYGIRAAGLLGKEKNAEYSLSALFVVAASSFQLLPDTVISLLSSGGADEPYGIILPSLITGAAALAVGLVLVKILVRSR